MRRNCWRRLSKRQRTASVVGALAVGVILAGAVVYSNLLERQAKETNSQVPRGIGTTADLATGATDPTDVSPAGWVSFEGMTLTLELPGWFVGGKPDDARARAALERVVGMDLDEWFDLYAWYSLEQGKMDMLAAGASGPETGLIVVTAETDVLAPGSSLGAYVEELGAWFADGELSVETITADRVFCRLDSQRVDDTAQAMVSRLALIRSGDRVHIVSYTAPAELSALLDSIFETSAGTIVIRE